eukprot:COSAG01_NODE_29241_length_642_cov_0.836096_1_plen_73_part_10
MDWVVPSLASRVCSCVETHPSGGRRGRVTVPAGGKTQARDLVVEIPRQLMLTSESGAPVAVAGAPQRTTAGSS